MIRRNSSREILIHINKVAAQKLVEVGCGYLPELPCISSRFRKPYNFKTKMSQSIRVLQCFDCETYQVDLVKKAKRWQCKMCGVKQSLRTEYFRGTGAECRVKVQELNKQKELPTQNADDELLQLLSNKDFNREEKQFEVESDGSAHANNKDAVSKWTSYVDQNTGFRKGNVTKEIESRREHLFKLGSSMQKWERTLGSNNSCMKRKLAVGVEDQETNKKMSKWGNFV